MPARAAFRPALRSLLAVAGLVALASLAVAQDAKKADGKEAALRLPDGTVVFFTRTPDDPLPAVEGVLLSPKEYKLLLDQAEQLRKSKETTKPLPPSACHVRGELKRTAERPVAALTLTYQFRTTTPRAMIGLGLQKAFALTAALDGRTPVLEATPDGLLVHVEAAGDHSLTVTAETPIGPHGPKAEPGFDIGLPRAAITTFALAPPGADITLLTVGTRTPDPANIIRPPEVKTIAVPVARFVAKADGAGQPLGPTDLLEVSWAMTAPPPPGEPGVEADIIVKIDESQIETLAKLKLRGPSRDWTFTLPAGAEMTATRTAPGEPAQITRPSDPKKREWQVKLPELGDWTLTVSVRQSRPEAKDPKYAGPYPVGPLFVAGVKQTGTLRVFAPVTNRLNIKPTSDVRRQDVPPVADDGLVALFKYAIPPAPDRKPAALLEIEVRPGGGFVAVQSTHALTLTPAGWRLRTTIRATPVRAIAEQLVIELPAGWQDPTVLPLELVDEVIGGGDPSATRTLIVRLAAGKREPFELTLDVRRTLAADAREALLPLPRFPQARERESQLTVTVPDTFDVKASAREWDAGKPAALSTELKPATPPGGAGASSLAGRFDAGVASAEITWQPHRPDLTAELRADVTVSDRQAVITQTLKLKATGPAVRPIRLKGPAAATGFRATPSLDPAGPGEWTFTPTAGAKDSTLVVTYAVPLPPKPAEGSAKLLVPLLWPDATRVETAVRIFGTAAGGRRAVAVEGPWRELPPDPAADRDTLPTFTLAATGVGTPLTLELAETTDATATVVVDRAVVQWWAADDGTIQGRSRFLLRRWPAAGIDLDVFAAGAVQVTVDRLRIDSAPVALEGDVKQVHVPLPEYRAARPVVVVEVRFGLPPTRSRFETVLPPPRVRAAALRSSAWWQLTAPAGTVPLAFGDLLPDFHWHFRGGLLAPAAGTTTDEIDKWFADGTEPDAEAAPWFDAAAGDAVTARVPHLVGVRVLRLPRLPLVIGSSLLVLTAALALTRLPGKFLAPLIAGLGLGLAAIAVLLPQPAAQLAAAAEPGLLAAVLGRIVQLLVKQYYRHRVTRLSAFTRVARPPSRNGNAPPPPSRAASVPAVVALGSASAGAAP